MALKRIPREVILLSASIFFADASHSIMIPIFPGFAQKIGASLSVLGSYGSVSAITMLLFSLPLGRLSDRIGRKKMMTPGLVLFIIVPLSYLIVKTPIHLYPIRVLLGLGLGLVFGNGFLLMTKVSKPEHRNTAQGMYMTSMGLGFTVGPLIGGYTTKLYGNTLSFYLSSLCGLLSIIILQLVKETRIDNEIEQTKTSLSEVIRDPQVLAAGLANYLNSLMYNALTLFYPVYGASIGFDEAQIGVGFTTRGLASTAVRLPVGSIAKHLRVLNLMVSGLLLSAITIFSVSMSTGLALISALMGIQGIAYGIYLTSGNIYVANNSIEENRGTAMATFSMFGNLSGIINPLILGLIAENLGSRGALQFSTMATILGVILVYYIASKNSPSA
jgi:MFS family permease